MAFDGGDLSVEKDLKEHLNFGSGDRPARERACRRRSPSRYSYDVGLALLFRLLYSPSCLSSGGGSSYSSVAAGLREVDASSDPSSSVLSLGGEGSLNLASPALCFVLSDDLSIGSMKLSEVETKRGREKLFGVSELEVCGGGAPATSRDGGGQVEAEETRVLLMGFYPSTRPASLTRGPTEIGRVWFGPQAC
uniref:Uncharacterized protein n=1 Tax=Brassica oleracea TaxID=3712 RepID=A0A3P6FZR9_BRAOL|nr:unnamed protein product [Brassica oleracea]